MAKKPKAAKPNANPDDIARCFVDYSSLRGDVARMTQKITATLGRYEKQGVDVKAIKHAYSESQKDPLEVAATERRNAEYVRLLGIISTEDDGQGSFGDGLAENMPSESVQIGIMRAKAQAEGYAVGLNGGKVESCRLTPGSEAYVTWREGFEDGHADRIMKNPDGDKVKKADTRRGRKKRDADISETVGHA